MKLDNKLKIKILEKIKPTEYESKELNEAVSRFLKRLKRSSKKLNFDCEFFIGGSFGKGTYLKNSSDIDIFVRFNYKYKNEDISKLLEKILLNAGFLPQKQKGSRDYFSLKFNSKGLKIIFELIPNLLISNIDDAENTTDLSPFHVLFLKNKIKYNPNLGDEIRIAKQFFKAKKLYGAESYINGFSGHIIDILVAYYGSFEDLILNGKNWGEETIIDINNFYSSKEEVLNLLDEDKKSNLIIIDPIIKERNASRALSNDNYCKFILICNEIFERKNKFEYDDFEVLTKDYKEVLKEAKEYAKKNNLKFISYKINFEIKNQSQDIVGSKLLKLERKFIKYFESLDFKLFLDDFYIDINNGVSLFIFLFEKINLPRIKKIIGPKVFMFDAVKNFLKDKDYYFIENSRVCIYEPRISYKLEEVSNITLEDSYKMLNKDISFIKNIIRKY